LAALRQQWASERRPYVLAGNGFIAAMQQRLAGLETGHGARLH